MKPPSMIKLLFLLTTAVSHNAFAMEGEPHSHVDQQHHHHHRRLKVKQVVDPVLEAEVQKWQPIIAERLFICRHAPAVCSPDMPRNRLHYALVAAGKMHYHIWGVGGWLLSVVGFLLLGAAIWISNKVDEKEPLDEVFCRGEDEYQPLNKHGENGETTRTTKGDTESLTTKSKSNDGTVKDNPRFIPSSGSGQYAARFAVFWNTHIARNHGGKKDKKNEMKNVYSSSANVDVEMIDDKRSILNNSSSKTMPSQRKHQQHPTKTLESDSDEEQDAKALPNLHAPNSNKGSTSLKAICRRIPTNVMNYWTTNDPTLTFTEPLLTFKAFIVILLFIELNDIMAPEQSMLATPELVDLVRVYPKRGQVYPYTEVLMPNMMDDNDVNAWVQVLQVVRAVLILSWFAFVLIPKKHAMGAGGFCYAVGAILYCYLGVIGLMYNLSHSTQGGMLFIFSAIFAVPFLETSQRANHWLRKLLYINILVPIYLFSGICKLRYLGIIPNLTGSWMWRHFDASVAQRVVWKSMFEFADQHHWVSFLFSWGNLIGEVVLPMAIMLYTSCWQLQLAFHGSEMLFHFSIFLLLGPNFCRYCLLHVLALNPLGYIKRFAKRDEQRLAKQRTTTTVSRAAQQRQQDWIRIFYAIVVLLGWWHAQFRSDLLHVFGLVAWRNKINAYFPFPELSMFAKPVSAESTNFGFGLLLTTLSFVALVVDMIR